MVDVPKPKRMKGEWLHRGSWVRGQVLMIGMYTLQDQCLRVFCKGRFEGTPFPKTLKASTCFETSRWEGAWPLSPSACSPKDLGRPTMVLLHSPSAPRMDLASTWAVGPGQTAPELQQQHQICSWDFHQRLVAPGHQVNKKNRRDG